MTVAVCFYCAARKWGCWTECEACGLTPYGEEPVAWSLILSDQFVDIDQLDKAAEIILRTGAMPEVDPIGIEKALQLVRSQAHQLRKMKLLPPETPDEPMPAPG